MRLSHWFHVHVKLLLRWFKLLDSFCKHCGQRVRDFQAPDDVWKRVVPSIRIRNVLCYDCFCETCVNVGLPSIQR